MLHSFQGEQKQEDGITVPEGSEFLVPKILPDGIYVFYSVPEQQSGDTRVDRFSILKPNDSIPDISKADFIDILDTIVEIEGSNGEQGIMIFPIYKFKN